MLDREKAKSVETRRSKSGSTYKVFIFECLVCNSDIRAQIHQLKTHSGKCMRCAQKKKPYSHIYNELLKSKQKQNVTITFEDFLELISSRKCHYCNTELHFNPHTRNKNGEHVSRAYQLDRKDNTLGYLKENLVACCWECNRMKSNVYSYEEFLKIGKVLSTIRNSKV